MYGTYEGYRGYIKLVHFMDMDFLYVGILGKNTENQCSILISSEILTYEQAADLFHKCVDYGKRKYGSTKAHYEKSKYIPGDTYIPNEAWGHLTDERGVGVVVEEVEESEYMLFFVVGDMNFLEDMAERFE
jgi:hypothetical protein